MHIAIMARVENTLWKVNLTPVLLLLLVHVFRSWRPFATKSLHKIVDGTYLLRSFKHRCLRVFRVLWLAQSLQQMQR